MIFERGTIIAMNCADDEDQLGLDSERTLHEWNARDVVLIADEDAMVRLDVTRMLHRLGCNTMDVPHGSEVLEACAVEHGSMLLIDLQLATAKDYELVRQTRANDATSGLSHRPIIMLAHAPLATALEHCRAGGMDACLVKPIVASELEAALRRWLPGAASLAAKPGGEGTGSAAVLDPRPVLDLDVLRELIGDDDAVIEEIVKDFLTTLREAVAEATAALARGDLSAASAIGHKMKSSARSVGALPLADTCEALEQAASASGDGSPQSLLLTMQSRATQVIERADELGYPLSDSGRTSP